MRLTPEDLRAWRSLMGLTQREAAQIVNPEVTTGRLWQAWELKENRIPSWLYKLLRDHERCVEERLRCVHHRFWASRAKG